MNWKVFIAAIFHYIKSEKGSISLADVESC